MKKIYFTANMDSPANAISYRYAETMFKANPVGVQFGTMAERTYPRDINKINPFKR